MTDLQSIFHFGEVTIRAMAKHNILVPDKTITLKDGRKHYIYDKKKVDHFKKNHVTIKEGAIQLGVSEVTIRRWLKRGLLNDVMKGISKTRMINVKELNHQLKKESA